MTRCLAQIRLRTTREYFRENEQQQKAEWNVAAYEQLLFLQTPAFDHETKEAGVHCP